jgi:hypothetical protein
MRSGSCASAIERSRPRQDRRSSFRAGTRHRPIQPSRSVSAVPIDIPGARAPMKRPMPKPYTERCSHRVRERSGQTRSQERFVRPRLTSRASARSGLRRSPSRTDAHRRMHEADRRSDPNDGRAIRLLLPDLWDRARRVQLRGVRRGLLLPVLQHPAAGVAGSSTIEVIHGLPPSPRWTRTAARPSAS